MKQPNNLFADTAMEVETLTKVKARNMASALAENIEANYFKLGGVLNMIKENSWFEGYESFNLYIFEEFGFQPSKASYLINIYKRLVEKQIPWEKVKHLGWCKVRLIAGIITLENLDEWVAKAEKLTYADLDTVLKAKHVGDSDITTTSEMVSLKFKLHKDQAEVVQQGLAKIKGEIQTEADSVALAAAARLILEGPTKPMEGNSEQLKPLMQKHGYERVLMAFGEMWPEIDIQVTVPEAGPEVQQHAAA